MKIEIFRVSNNLLIIIFKLILMFYFILYYYPLPYTFLYVIIFILFYLHVLAVFKWNNIKENLLNKKYIVQGQG